MITTQNDRITIKDYFDTALRLPSLYARFHKAGQLGDKSLGLNAC